MKQSTKIDSTLDDKKLDMVHYKLYFGDKIPSGRMNHCLNTVTVAEVSARIYAVERSSPVLLSASWTWMVVEHNKSRGQPPNISRLLEVSLLDDYTLNANYTGLNCYSDVYTVGAIANA
ncbi:hypothetical protein KQX54_003956 [Cotesia glomerata]|uniref:Uncharacterized protein n=1 Tax=Cotesia glomerata TaxID=32391 RepID=A0AAV7I3L7_COTGL|nr:hypothetical protein KQX54_003956 [Cotesia glomerata]